MGKSCEIINSINGFDFYLIINLTYDNPDFFFSVHLDKEPISTIDENFEQRILTRFDATGKLKILEKPNILIEVFMGIENSESIRKHKVMKKILDDKQLDLFNNRIQNTKIRPKIEIIKEIYSEPFIRFKITTTNEIVEMNEYDVSKNQSLLNLIESSVKHEKCSK